MGAPHGPPGLAALFFGFQNDNVQNQLEHLVLHLANAQMRLSPPPDNIDVLDAAILRCFRKKLLRNYNAWCSYLDKKSNIWISDCQEASAADHYRELLYVSLEILAGTRQILREDLVEAIGL